MPSAYNLKLVPRNLTLNRIPGDDGHVIFQTENRMSVRRLKPVKGTT